jgi:F0F1-type ATP synthase assembly protein I
LSGVREAGAVVSEPQQQSPWAFASVGLELVIPVALLTYGGYWLDGRLHTLPLFLILGLLLGMAVGFYSVFRRVLPPKGSGR